MNLATWAFAFVLVALFGSMPASGQRRQPAQPNPGKEGYDWKGVARACGLIEEDIASLEKNKVLMTNQAFKQIFTPYVTTDLTKPSLPLFITSDSLLNAFHVLFDESILRLELANTTRLTGLLEALWERLAGGKKDFADGVALVQDASRRAHIVLGVGLTLLGRPPRLEDQELAKIIAAESERVVAATDQTKPVWLGPPEADFITIDYSRYRPRGYYTRDEKLKRHFRAVSWLQSIPFRVAKDEELLAALQLGHAARGLDLGVVQTYRHFIGAGDDWDLIAAAAQAGDPVTPTLSKEYLEAVRLRLVGKVGEPGQAPQINDQIRFPPADLSVTAEPSFRVLPAYRTSDSVLFHRTTDLRVFPDRGLPTGLEVCAALGSPFAGEQLAVVENGKVLAIIDRNRSLFAAGNSLYFQYLGCLSTLLRETEPGAPTFMSSHAWQAKCCQAVLASWMQLRHTWLLQAKEPFIVLGGYHLPSGFVEPAQKFYRCMASLVRDTEARLESAGVFLANRLRLADTILEAVTVLNRIPGRPSQEWWAGIPDKDEIQFRFLEDLLEATQLAKERKGNKIEARVSALVDSIPIFEKLVADLKQGKGIFDTQLHVLISPFSPIFPEIAADLNPLWKDLGEICDQLEELARRQLNGQAFTEDDDQSIRNYGHRIARVMMYVSNTYLGPNDDAPRIVDLAYDPSSNRYLHAGISRPRALFVLYPHQGREILCRGAVMPYYEFAHGDRLTDDLWKVMLDSDARPATPGWIRPIVGAKGIGVPDTLKEH